MPVVPLGGCCPSISAKEWLAAQIEHIIMLIVVKHQIADPVAFFERRPNESTPAPARIEPYGFYPSADGYEAVCLWEAGSIDVLESVLEPLFEGISEQQYYAIDEHIAFSPFKSNER